MKIRCKETQSLINKRIGFALILLICLNLQGLSQPDEHLMLWYDKPASDWMTEALPIGNGYMGDNVF